jgi:hypothetical protein
MIRTIPNLADWNSDKPSNVDDDELDYIRNLFLGKSKEEAISIFEEYCVIAICSSYIWMPRVPFQYYVFTMQDFVLRGLFGVCEDSDASSGFIRAISFKLKHDPNHIIPVLPELIPALRHIAENQEEYNASESIYGNFQDHLAEIEQMATGHLT